MTTTEERTTTDQTRQTRHALTVLAHTSTGRQRLIRACAEDYLSQVDRQCLPIGCNLPIRSNRANRADAFRYRRGDLLARLLGLAVRPDDEHLPDTARAVIAAYDEPVTALTDAAHLNGDPVGITVAYVIAGTLAPSSLAY
ncbi:hypothetical protein AB0A98_06255 [Streptomyces chrestomyceticus]|uniref:hypothetical protein n=1 Tax=Streptomyces chrestomyceticus TaxID=68185 RepID=UPI0033E8BB67